MTIYQGLCLIGIPGVCSGLVAYLIAKVRKTNSDSNAVKLGIQALLRDRLYQSYNRYSDKGYAPLYAKENFENMWSQYHSLGANGVMDDVHRKFLELPDPPED